MIFFVLGWEKITSYGQKHFRETNYCLCKQALRKRRINETIIYVKFYSLDWLNTNKKPIRFLGILNIKSLQHLQRSKSVNRVYLIWSWVKIPCLMMQDTSGMIRNLTLSEKSFYIVVLKGYLKSVGNWRPFTKAERWIFPFSFIVFIGNGSYIFNWFNSS